MPNKKINFKEVKIKTKTKKPTRQEKLASALKNNIKLRKIKQTKT